MSAALALQRALRARLVADAGVSALVAPAAILDRHQRPAPSPSIILGEVQVIDDGADLARRRLRITHTLHVWKREPSLEGVAEICGRIRAALAGGGLELAGGYHCAGLAVTSLRSLRDPDGETSHGIVTVEAVVVEPAP